MRVEINTHTNNLKTADFTMQDMYNFFTSDSTDVFEYATNLNRAGHIIAWLPCIAAIRVDIGEAPFMEFVFTSGETVRINDTGYERALHDYHQ